MQTLNALFMLRCSLKILVQTLSEDNVTQQFMSHQVENVGQESVDGNKYQSGAVIVEHLVCALVETLVDVELT